MAEVWQASAFIFFFVFLRAAAQHGFISIDCGAAHGFKSASNISWVSDHGYVWSGLNAEIKGNDLGTLQTLRYFENSTSSGNCYYLPVIPKRRYLLRASYYYGNYDAKSLWPTFTAYVDQNEWNAIHGQQDYYYVYESIWTAQNRNLSFCLRSSDGKNVPFISALESRLLPLGSYSFFELGNEPFFRISGWNLGAESLLRYPYDPYDRFWHGVNSPRMIHTSKNIPSATLADNPPKEVLLTAQEGPINMSAIDYSWDIVSSTSQVYLNLYFWDFRERTANASCEFLISFKLDDLIVNEAIFPLDYEPLFYTTLLYNLPSNFTLGIVLSPLANSTLPPLINALEIYEVGYHIKELSPSLSPSPSPSPSMSTLPSPSPFKAFPPSSPSKSIATHNLLNFNGNLSFILLILYLQLMYNLLIFY